jgi:hypothetical protein
MPIRKYDPYFGKKGGAQKAYDSMVKQYGPKKGPQVFYGLVNKRKKRQSKGGLGQAMDRRKELAAKRGRARTRRGVMGGRAGGRTSRRSGAY